MEFDARPVEYRRNFWRRAGLAVRQPLARHLAAVAKRVEVLVVDRGHRLQIEHKNRHADLLHQRQDSVAERIGRDEEKNDLDVLFPQPVPAKRALSGLSTRPALQTSTPWISRPEAISVW